MANKSVKGKIATELLLKYPKHPTKSLAEIAFKNNPSVFMNVEDARGIIRRHRGESGEKNRTKYKHFKEHGNQKEYHIPKSNAKDKEVFTFPSGYKRVGIISDIQCPFHDEKAVQITIDYLLSIKIDCLLINGDFVDFYNLSSFQKDPRKRNFASEREDCIELLRYIKSKFKCPIYYNLAANHEYRYERYMMIKAPEFFSTDLFHVEDLLMLNDIGIIPLKFDHIRIGKLAVIHGDTVFKSWGSVNPAKTVYDKLKQTALVSHCHKKSEYTWTTLNGETHSTWTTGCLMNLNVEYNPHGNNYVHGFAVVDLLDKGMFSVDNKMIINGKVV